MNLKGRMGGDSELSLRGVQFAKALSNYITSQNIPSLRVWTSWLKRTIQTVADIPAPQERWKALNEIDAVRNSTTRILNYNFFFVYEGDSNYYFIFCRVFAKK